MKWVYFLVHLLHGLVLIIKTLNDIIDLTFDNFYEKHRHRQSRTVYDFACEYSELTSDTTKIEELTLIGQNPIFFYRFELFCPFSVLFYIIEC